MTNLVEGSLFASYITFDLSPELTCTEVPASPEDRATWVQKEIPSSTQQTLRERLVPLGVEISDDAPASLLCAVWPALLKMKRRDEKSAENYRVLASVTGRIS